MFGKEIDAVLQKNLPALPLMVCERSLSRDIDELAASVFPGRRLAVVDDGNTAAVLGDLVFRAIKGRFECVHVTLERRPVAEQATVDLIRRRTGACDALIAVGGGTVSDLCKYASFLDRKPYILFPTAASMNGYLSANASITMEGYKKTLPAHMPLAVFCDLSVIAAAPVRLAKSGLGDALARSTAQADWLLSHLLLGTAYNELPFTLLMPLEPVLYENARGVARGDSESIRLLLDTLLLSGLGMTLSGGSYPASQGEHMITHAYHMLSHEHASTLHGEEIGVTTLDMARLQEALLHRPLKLRLRAFPKAEIERLFGGRIAEEAKKAYAVKEKAIGDAKWESWEAIASRIEPVLLSPVRIASILEAAEAPTTLKALGWSENMYRTAGRYACFLRERFTFLDLIPG